MPRFIFAVIAIAALQATPAMAEGDPEAGRIKAYTCKGCHGIPDYKNIYPTYSVPKIGGQNEAYITAVLKAYRTGERKHPTMQAQAESMTDQDIADIAAWLGSLDDKDDS
ncbi:cytochrome c [Marinihelvus fidelis]|uniref:Cytochrome c n=1 Tax=Marinihelvus fidelis TaxID=2613842 RepID=A0A5N0TAT7_9GAMM|nr:cytochrome c [Marinihelvus fidelis]KAA9132050.1 cytochrome c [Marinihelvus fidelis]